MKKRTLFCLPFSALLLTGIFGASFLNFSNKNTSELVSASTGSYSRNLSTYYTSAFSHKVTSSQYGTTLLNTLHELLYDTHGTYNTYDDLWDITKNTDYDIDNPDNIVLLYSRQSIDGTPTASSWNREHVWCKSLSGGLYTTVSGTTTGAGSDIHHLRPASTAYNSTRGNTPYGVVSSHTASNRMGDTDCYMDSSNFEPADYLKGDVARVIMYMYTHYSTEVSGTSTKSGALSITNIVNKSTSQAAWDLLMDWNELDPVDYSEIIRNNQACFYTGNYNPFIDHPEFARMIWDDTSSQQAGLFFQTSYKTVNVGSNYTNTASAYGNVTSSDSIVYTSDNPEIASVNSSTGQVTGVSNGVARIKARATINNVSRISYHFVVVGSGYTPKYTMNASGIVYTPISSSSARASETIGSETVTFSNTYTTAKFHTQMTGGKTATLTISNFPKTIKSITLSMHSNKSSGAGTITVTVGGSNYSSKTGNFSSIYGSYSESYVPIDMTNSSASKKTGTIVITIAASTSSLFFEKAIIDYTERTVTKASSISVSPSSISMTPGEDNILTTNFSPSNTTLKTNTWSSSNTSVATVTKYGLVRAISVGSATITATASDGSGKTGTSLITVSNSVAPSGDPTVTGVTVTPNSTSLDVTTNPTANLTAVVNGTNNPSQAVTWTVSASNPSGCVTVNSGGVVTAVSAGSATVKATSVADSNYSGTCTITVTNTPKTLSSITLDTTNVQKSFTVNDTFNYTGLVVTAHYTDSTSSTVIPTSVTSPNMSTTGQKTVTVSYMLNSVTKEASYTISVSAASSNVTVSVSIAEYANTNSWSNGDKYESIALDAIATASVIDGGSNSGKYYTSGNEWRYYQSESPSIQISLASGYELVSITLTYNISNTGALFNGQTQLSSGVAISASGSSASYTVGNSGSATNGQVKFTNISVTYHQTAQAVTLSSITLDTTNVQKSFTINDTFSYTGLIVTAHYSDSSSSTVTPTSVSSPNMSTTGNKTVTVTYTENAVSKTANYSITVNSNPSISWTAPTINVYSGSTLSGTDVNAWAVTYNDGAGHQTVLTFSQLTVKLGGSTISIPHTWSSDDDGKTLTATYNSLTTSESAAIQVTQTVNAITYTSETSTETSNLVFTAKYATQGGNADDGKTWVVTSDAAESTYDSTKGIHYGTGSAAVEYIQLVSDSFTTGTITQVVVNASGASGVTGSVSVTVGGNAFGEVQSFNSTASDKTFTGTASAGQIVVRIYKAAAANKAIYCKSVVVTNNVPGSSTVISNNVNHIAAQRVAVKFANAFNAAMDTTSGCTTNLSSAWSTCSSAYNTFLTEAAALGESEEAYAKSLIANATKQYTDDSGEACIERMMKTYQVCVQKHGQTPFMSELVSLSKIAINPLQVSVKNSSTAIIIIVISAISVITIAGYFYFRKKKD